MDNNFKLDFKPTESPVGQQADIFGALDQGFSGAISGQETVPNMIGRYNEQYGVPQMQQQIQQGTEQYDYLGNQIRNMPNQVQQGSQESILTQGQLGRVTQAQQAPLLEQQGQLGQNLTRMGQNLGTAQTNASTMVSAEQAQQAKELQPFLQKYSNESVLSAMRSTAWSTENSMELQRLLANQQAGITLSEGEKNRMNSLAVAEKNFDNQIKLNEQTAKLSNDQSQLMPVGAGTSIFDPRSGKFIGTAPYKPESGGGQQMDINASLNTIRTNRNSPPVSRSTNSGPAFFTPR